MVPDHRQLLAAVIRSVPSHALVRTDKGRFSRLHRQDSRVCNVRARTFWTISYIAAASGPTPEVAKRHVENQPHTLAKPPPSHR